MGRREGAFEEGAEETIAEAMDEEWVLRLCYVYKHRL